MPGIKLLNLVWNSDTLINVAELIGIYAGHGLQLSIPLGVRHGVPVSVSLVACYGADRFLLSVAQELYATLKEETRKTWSSPDSSL